ncbi:MAG: TPM domain-containing protein [Deltaproteobacteria bacterium]
MARLERHLDPASRERIAAAVREAERRTVGQIVPLVVERSIDHDLPSERLGWLGLLLATALVFAFQPQASLSRLVSLQLGGGVLGLLLSLVPAVERRLLGRRRLERAVRDRAFRAFHGHGLHRAEGRAGVLIFASLFERRVVILGDEGIHADMGEEGWSVAVRLLTQRLREGAPADGFCDAIALVGERLAARFPRDPTPPANPSP